MLCCTRETFTGRYTNLILKTTEWMIYKVLSLYYVHRFPTPYQLLYFVLDNFESLLFSLRLDLPFCVGIYQSYQIDSVFPPSIRPLSTMLWSRAVVSRVEYNWLTNRFHVAVRLFSNRSQMTSKCRKNKEVAHEPQASVSLLFLPHFDVLCDLLLNRPTATWNLFVLYNDQKRKKTDTHTCLVPLDCSRICASLGIFKSQALLFVSASSFFLYLTCIQFLRKVFQRLFLLKAE